MSVATIVPATYPCQGTTMRDVLTDLCRRRFPTITLKNDYYTFMLSEIDADTLQSFSSDQDVYTYIDSLFASETERRPDHAEALLQYIGDILDSSAEHLNGVKPPPGFKDPGSGVVIHSIPHCNFSVRLFPGNPAEQLYCLDFVRDDTGDPVNSPFEFELWAGLWPRFALAPMFSIEESVGLAPESILPGEEKFVLRDGYTCMLKRKGCGDMVFVVPVRGGSDGGRRRTAKCPTCP